MTALAVTEKASLREDEFSERLQALRPRLVAMARSMVRPQDVDDLVQASLELALRHRSQLRDPARLWPWLAAIQSREALKLRRRLLTASHLWPWLNEAVEDPSRDEFTDLRTALQKLRPRIRACLVLHYMADLSVADTAEALGVSTNTIKTQLKTGLSELRGMLK